MNIVKSIHETAMEYSVLGGISLAKDQEQEALEAYSLAYELEKKAAFKTTITEVDKLSRFILLRSAAALALKAKKPEESEKLVKIAFSENPPSWLQAELKEIESLIEKEKQGEDFPIAINGVVTQANATEKAITIENAPHTWSVLVLNNQLDDIVLKFWKKTVHILGRKSPRGVIVLEEIGV